MPTYVVGSGETYANLHALVGTWADGDTLQLTDTALIDDSASQLANIPSVNIEPHANNTTMPEVRLLPSNLSLYFANNGVGGRTIKGVKFTKVNSSHGSFIENGYPNTTIEECRFEDLGTPTGDLNGRTVWMNQTGAGSVSTIQNCVFVNTINGIEVWEREANILNNSFYSVGSIGSALRVLKVTAARIYNNIIHTSNVGIEVYNSSGVLQDYNTLHNCTTEYGGSAATAANNRDSIQTPGVTDPLYTNAAGGDLTLQASSPCIDDGAGTSVYALIPTTDFIGTSRPQGSACDMGAYEFLAATIINAFSQGAATKNVEVTSTVDSSALVAKIQATGTDTYFDSTDEVASVMVEYLHEGGRQKKRIYHQGLGLSGSVFWGDNARDGTWEKNRIVTYGTDGASNTLTRSDIGTDEDLTMSDGTMTLNT